MAQITMCADSGTSETKSQKVSWAEPPVGISLWGSGLTAWTKSGNLIASWMKNTGMLLPTRSKLPSSVKNFTAKPRTSRTVSPEPRGPWTVEKRTKTGVLSAGSWRKPALVSAPWLP